MNIEPKTPREIEVMAEGGKILAEVLEEISQMVRPGVTPLELDHQAEKLILEKGAIPAFKGYDGFPNTLCASVNQVIVHGLPTGQPLQGGDIIGLDLGVIWQGYYSDMAVTVGVGNINPQAKKLLSVTKQSLSAGLRETKPGATTGDIGFAVQSYVESQGFQVIRNLCGHGIGQHLHEDPMIPNYGKRGQGIALQEGMTICIEPMVAIGTEKIKTLRDGFGIATRDGSLAAHFEHTILVTKTGCEVLTKI